ncbi:class F sortase [Nocardioides piscis]|uniref:Class F sortase n=1 Tax=Nocardioides piscis TaxID=2714938 RepID=A0A6G7YEN6_9ACTN|nr:class F sortase [Nocardioides piscis]QIK75189.1 class F sortase [Nocardioides piscis]
MRTTKRLLIVPTLLLSLGGAGIASASQATTSNAVTQNERVVVRAPLKVPKLGITGARIIPVGLTRGGQLAVGPSVTAVYVWNNGVRPGQPGSAVIAGHTWSRGAGVFDNLGRLGAGDRFSVGRSVFVVNRVRRVQTLGPRAVRDLFSDRGPSRVVLITCGDRSATTGVYASRILVYAEKV